MADENSTPQGRAPLPLEGVARVVQAVKRQDELDNDDGSLTPYRKELEAFVQRLEDLATFLSEATLVAFHVQPIHERPHIGADGHPIEGRPRSVLQISDDLSKLAESTRLAIDELPRRRKKTALRLAALGYAHLAYEAGRSRPTSYVNGHDVQEIAQICKSAGLRLSDETIKNELGKQLEFFEPAGWPSDLPRIFG